MEFLEEKISKATSEIYEIFREEFERLKGFQESGEIDDFKLECEISLLGDFEKIVTCKECMNRYFEDNNCKKEIRRLENKEAGFNCLYDFLLTCVKSTPDVENKVSEMNYATCIMKVKCKVVVHCMIILHFLTYSSNIFPTIYAKSQTQLNFSRASLL